MAFQGQLAVFDFGDSDNNNALTTPDEVRRRSGSVLTFEVKSLFSDNLLRISVVPSSVLLVSKGQSL